MTDSTVLLVALFLPLVGALAMWPLAPLGRSAVRTFALGVTTLTLLAAGLVVARFPADGRGASTYAVLEYDWLGAASSLDIRFSIGLDGLGLWLFGLSALLMVTAVLVGWRAIARREALYYAMLLLLEFGCLGVFVARDIILFYVFFEFTLIPLFFLIGIWGSEQRRHAATKFFLFTLAGSVLTFLGLLSIVHWVYQQQGIWTFSIPEITRLLAVEPLSVPVQCWIFLALLAGFAIKVPLFPLHTWLPLAHVQAPTAGSVILAGILLKIGTYGFLRFSIPLLPDASALLMPLLLWLSVAGIIYGALVALAQRDIKRLIAYSSVSHLGFCMLGLFALTPLGLRGATLQMINHGISTGGLFALVGMLYERYHTREIDRFGGLARKMPWLAFFLLLFTFSSIGLPGLNGFVGEFLVLLGAFQRAWGDTTGWSPIHASTVVWMKAASVLAVGGVVLGAWYMLWVVQRVLFGRVALPEADQDGSEPRDLSWREIAALAPLAVFVFWIGLFPQVFLGRMERTLSELTSGVETRIESRYGPVREASVDGPSSRGEETGIVR